MNHLLEEEFIGKGEVKGFHFEQIESSSKAYIYQVHTKFERKKLNGGYIDISTESHYEVFVRKFNPKCIDFENRIYSNDEFVESYPKSNAFGVWAWTFNDLDSALSKMQEIEQTLSSKDND